MSVTFKYRVRDRAGKVYTGEVEAPSADLAARRLRERGLTPLKVERKAAGILQQEITIPGLSNRIKQRDVVIFSRQFATMVNSGLSLLKSLSVLVEQTESPALAEVIRQVKTDVEKGTSLSAALERHPKAFSPLYVSMIRAGEIGGVLDETLERLADILEGNLELRSKVRSALAYPTVVGFLIVAITTGMIMFVVPVFVGMYEEVGGGAALPIPTQILIAVSGFLGSWWWALTALVVAAWFALRWWRRTPEGRYLWDAFKLRIPVFGRLFHKTALSRFARTFAVLSRTGVPVLQTLDIVAETSGNAKIERAIEDVKASVREGESLALPLARHEVFPPMVVQMLTVGEETGALDAMLGKVADFYEREVADMVTAMTSLIEPLLIVVMGVTVGGILIALYLPIFSLANFAG
ncbi:MAG TPA: type II secretion system F family protein [Actinobacteria bacterium]|nr:type II secretion system F family protein [Actinomycetota bacterium]